MNDGYVIVPIFGLVSFVIVIVGLLDTDLTALERGLLPAYLWPFIKAMGLGRVDLAW